MLKTIKSQRKHNLMAACFYAVGVLNSVLKSVLYWFESYIFAVDNH
jgi:hypothetical protein